MRDPERIGSTLAQLEELWLKHPDLRLTQLLFNTASGPGEAASMFYNTEDDELCYLMKVYGAEP